MTCYNLPVAGTLPLVNECKYNNGLCTQVCVDTYDSYYCTCRSGYRLGYTNYFCPGRPTVIFTFIINSLMVTTRVAMWVVFSDVGLWLCVCYPAYVSIEGYIGYCFFLCPVFTDISATVAPIGVKFCITVHIGPRQIFSPFGAVPQGIPKSENLGLNFGHLKKHTPCRMNTTRRPKGSRSVTCQLELTCLTSARRDLSNVSYGAVPSQRGVEWRWHTKNRDFRLISRIISNYRIRRNVTL